MLRPGACGLDQRGPDRHARGMADRDEVEKDRDLNTEPGLAESGGDTFRGELKTELDKELHPSKVRTLWQVIRASMPF